MRGMTVFREFSKNPIHSSLLKKLTRIFQSNPQFKNNVKQETAAVQLLSVCFEKQDGSSPDVGP